MRLLHVSRNFPSVRVQPISLSSAKMQTPVEWASFFDGHRDELAVIARMLDTEEKHFLVYPARDVIFRALEDMAPEDVKVVIIGQDPYVNGNATGRCFEVPCTAKMNPSLKNIFKAVQAAGYETKSSDLSGWANQGVLLLNTALTVRERKPGSHMKHWVPLVKALLAYIETTAQPLWLLWGRHAKNFCPGQVSNDRKLESPHPSPLARDAFQKSQKRRNHFAHVNSVLRRDIDWST